MRTPLNSNTFESSSRLSGAATNVKVDFSRIERKFFAENEINIEAEAAQFLHEVQGVLDSSIKNLTLVQDIRRQALANLDGEKGQQGKEGREKETGAFFLTTGKDIAVMLYPEGL